MDALSHGLPLRLDPNWGPPSKNIIHVCAVLGIVETLTQGRDYPPARHPSDREATREGMWRTPMTKHDTRFKPGVSGNETTKWRPGQSGNPAGKSRRRMAFEESFNEALLAGGGPEEAARLLWEAARNKEPWAIQELTRRFAPQTQSLHLIHEVDDDTLDYTRLTNDQLRQLDAIFEQAWSQPLSSKDGDGAPKSA